MSNLRKVSKGGIKLDTEKKTSKNTNFKIVWDGEINK